MEITGSNSQIQNYTEKAASAEETMALYQVKLLKMQQNSMTVAGDLIQDTVEISKEAMDKYLSEING